MNTKMEDHLQCYTMHQGSDTKNWMERKVNRQLENTDNSLNFLSKRQTENLLWALSVSKLLPSLYWQETQRDLILLSGNIPAFLHKTSFYGTYLQQQQEQTKLPVTVYAKLHDSILQYYNTTTKNINKLYIQLFPITELDVVADTILT